MLESRQFPTFHMVALSYLFWDWRNLVNRSLFSSYIVEQNFGSPFLYFLLVNMLECLWVIKTKQTYDCLSALCLNAIYWYQHIHDLIMLLRTSSGDRLPEVFEFTWYYRTNLYRVPKCITAESTKQNQGAPQMMRSSSSIRIFWGPSYNWRPEMQFFSFVKTY